MDDLALRKNFVEVNFHLFESISALIDDSEKVIDYAEHSSNTDQSPQRFQKLFKLIPNFLLFTICPLLLPVEQLLDPALIIIHSDALLFQNLLIEDRQIKIKLFFGFGRHYVVQVDIHVCVVLLIFISFIQTFQSWL